MRHHSTFPAGLTILISIFLCSAMITSCGSKEVEIVQNYGTGEVSRKHTEINGKKQGKMIEYYKDGKIKGERLFKDDIQIDKSTFYYPSGKVQEVQYYEEGKMNGGDTVFYESGQPQFLRTYNKGVLDGYIRKWAQDGSIIYEAKYRNDTLIEVKGVPVHPDTLMQQADTMHQQ
jgi:antitoxin component YwqK of YwqJK toxin-antitoxin module